MSLTLKFNQSTSDSALKREAERTWPPSASCGTMAKHTHNASLGVPLAAVAEGGGQRGGAALVVQRRAAVVDGRVDGDGPHAGGVAVAVAVVVASAIARRPHVDAAFAAAALEEGRAIGWMYR